jgi:cell division protein FtsL
MKRSLFITIFITANIAFIVLHLHKQSQIIKFSYEKQKIEYERRALAKQKQELTHQIYTLHDRGRVKEFAYKNLGMEPVKISQIKKIGNDASL